MGKISSEAVRQLLAARTGQGEIPYVCFHMIHHAFQDKNIDWSARCHTCNNKQHSNGCCFYSL